MFIPDPDIDFFPPWIPDLGVGKATDPGSGSARLMMRKMCAAEEEQLLDSVMDCGHGNWSDIGNNTN
jgi:hypothetical protein